MTSLKNADITRRRVMTATGLGAVALAGLARSASAATSKMTATEKANAKVVADFMKMWSDPDCTGEKLATFVSNNCVLRMEENKPAVEGRANAVAAFNVFLKDGQRWARYRKAPSSCAMERSRSGPTTSCPKAEVAASPVCEEKSRQAKTAKFFRLYP